MQTDIQWFRNSSPYINAHRGKTFVVAFAGEAVADDNFHHLIQDIVLLHSLGIRLVLVHGARVQIDQRLQESQLPNRVEHHRRVTDIESLSAVIEAITRTSTQVQANLVQAMAAAHLSGEHSTIITGNFVIARPYGVHHGVDFQHSGEVRKINSQSIGQKLSQGNLVLLSPLGYSPTGEVFNLLWEEVAEATAAALKADKIIYMDANEGLFDADNHLLRELTTAQCKHLIEQQPVPNYTLISAHSAVSKGVSRSHIISYQSDGALLQELFTLDGKGTLITQEIYEKVRLATIDDVASVLEVIEPLETEGILVRRSRERLETEIEHFTVIERDNKIIACAALYPFTEEQCGELACVAVHPNYRHQQKGDSLLKAIEQRATMLGLTSLFVLTTRTAHWFKERGFNTADVAALPQHKQSLYNYQRNSKVFVKRLPQQR